MVAAVVGLLVAAPALPARASTGTSTASTSTSSPTAGTSPGRPPARLTVALPAPAAASILVDVDSGRALFEADAHDPLRPGSLTKTLTAMIAADWLPAGAQIPVNAVAFNAYPDKVGMKPGQRWPLPVALHALITDSANDAAYALAIDIGGSLAGFAPVLQEAAGQIGLSDHPTLEDPAGLDGTEGFDGGNRISAWDLSIMGRDMMADPQLAAIADLQTYDFEGPDNIAYHLVSRNYHFLASYPGAIGVKTGYTDAAGYCDIEEAQRGGRRMLAVVLSSTNPDADAAALITAGFTVPAGAETADPQLPPVAQPEPRSQPDPPRQGADARSASGAGNQAAAVQDPARTDHARNTVLDAVALASLAVGVFLWLRRFARRSQAGRRQATRRRGAASRYRPAHSARPIRTEDGVTRLIRPEDATSPRL